MEANEIADCQSDLLSFTKRVFAFRNKYEFIENWHHRKICEILEQVVLGKIRRLIINIPPRYSKTELAVINFIAWSMGIYPDSEFIHASYSKRLSAKNTWMVRSIVESDIYKNIFQGTHIKQDSHARDEWRTTAGGVVYATGTGGTITGYGAGKMRDGFGGAVIIDDPHKATDVMSDVKRENVIQWYNNTIISRTNNPNTPIILIQQRLHESDLTGYLLDVGNWEHLCIPVLKNNKPLWNYKHTISDINRLEKTSPYVYWGQYQQKPSPLGGGIFKDTWWKYYDILPSVDYKIITADTAQKVKEVNDYSVFQCWGYADGRIYLIDQLRGKWEAPELRQKFIQFWNAHKNIAHNTAGAIRSAYVEDKASGTGLIQDIRKSGNIPIVPIGRTVDKVSRAMDSAPYIASGYVYLPNKKSWILDYVTEFSKFTPLMTHNNDDQIDCTMDAIKIMLASKSDAGIWGQW